MSANAPYELANKKIYVAGHNGMVGRAVVRALEKESCEIITATRATLDLTQQAQVNEWMGETKPDAIIICAAQVGGIAANAAAPVDFLYNNLMIEANLIHAAHNNAAQKLLFLGSSCIYPRLANQPIGEEELLSGALEPSNQWYAVAKIAGIKLCQAYRRQYGDDFICAMPTNLYGEYDNFDLESSHVIPALLAKCHQAKQAGAAQLPVWGSGTPRREFLYVDDCAAGIIFLLKNYSAEAHINLGAGSDISIAELAELIKEITGFDGALKFDPTKPDGTPRKLLDTSKINKLGWRSTTSLKDGLTKTYNWLTEQ